MKKAKVLISSILALVIILMPLMSLAISSDTEVTQPDELSFKDGKFTIMHLSDPQDDRYPAYDLINFVKLAIEFSKPDLIVFTGDVVEDSRGADTGIDDEDTREGVSVYLDNNKEKLDYAKTLENTIAATDNIFSIINDAGIPFVTAQGNNDYASGVTNEDWLKIFSKYEYCLTKDESNDKEGRIDCNVEIKGKDGKTAFNIWMMDTGEKEVTKEQIEWYKAESSALAEKNGGEPVPSFVFQHIFTKDIGNLFERCHIWDDGATVKDLGFYRLNRDIATGYFEEISATPGKTTDQFKAWEAQGDVLGAYFGHEHYGAYTGKYKGIELGLTNGCEFSKHGPYGIRVFTLYEDDIKNYDNRIYVYTGSVKTGDAGFRPQDDEKYPTYESKDEMRAKYFENFKTNIVIWFRELFD